jgi:hypothetical protein
MRDGFYASMRRFGQGALHPRVVRCWQSPAHGDASVDRIGSLAAHLTLEAIPFGRLAS